VDDVRPRRARPEDVGAVRALVEDAYAKYVPRIGMRPLPMDDDYEARVARGEAWLIGDPLDAVLVLVPADGYLLVDNVAVRPELQGRGLGRALLAFAEERARADGLDELRLYTNEKMTENRALYTRLGYEEMAAETIEGRHAVWMRKALY
jgi:ribosomal protein S18 acetylase RimI-like enzyme